MLLFVSFRCFLWLWLSAFSASHVTLKGSLAFCFFTFCFCFFGSWLLGSQVPSVCASWLFVFFLEHLVFSCPLSSWFACLLGGGGGGGGRTGPSRLSRRLLGCSSFKRVGKSTYGKRCASPWCRIRLLHRVCTGLELRCYRWNS